MKKTFRTAMFSTIAMLIVGVMSLTGVTYAWFTQGTTATVDNVMLSVESASGGLQVSKTGDAWGSSVNLGIDETLLAVSTVGNLESNEMQFFRGTVDPADYSKITSEATTVGYVKTYIYLKNDTGSEVTVNLDGTNPAVVENFGKEAHFASRLGIVVVDRSSTSFALANDGFAEEGGVKTETLFNVTEKHIYEPFAKNHTDRASAVYGVDKEATAAEPYFGISGASTEAFVWNNDAAQTGKTGEVAGLTTDASTIEITVADGEYVKVAVYLWLEGQDLDCENSVSSDKFQFTIKFETVENPAG